MIARIYAMAVLALLLGASPSWAQEQQEQRKRFVPSIGSTRQEEKDPEVTGKQPLGKPLIDRTNFIADLITNRNARGLQVPGIDYFIEKLVDELRVGSDVPRKNILDNSLAARKAMRDGHADLRRGVALLMEARDIAMQVNEKLQPVVEENHMGLGRVLEAGAKLGKAVEEMKEEPPDAGSNPDDSALAALTDLASEIDPLRSKLQSAASKVEEAGNHFDKAKLRLGELEQRQRKALKLDRAASESLARSRPVTGARGASAGISSEKVIKNGKERLKETLDEAFKVRDAMRELTVPESGLGLAVEDASDANKKTQAAKDKVKSTTPKLIEAAMMLKNVWKPAYEQTADQQAAVEKAKAEIEKARNSLKELEDPFDKAKKADAKSYASAQDGDEKLEDLRHRQLGDRSKDGLTRELVDRRMRVADPKRRPPSNDVPGAQRQPPSEDDPRDEDGGPDEDKDPGEDRDPGGGP